MCPTYEWTCSDHNWDVMVPIANSEDPQSCPTCNKPGRRVITAPHIDRVAAGAWNQASYNPALGCWTKSWKHGREIAKARGLEEVGNTPVETLHKEAEKKNRDNRQRRWDEADRVKVYD